MPKKLHPPFAQPDPGRRATPQMAAEVSGEPPADASLPPIDEFVDELPMIDEFLMDARAESRIGETEPIARATGVWSDEGWADADWQSYDWSRLASLGAPEPEAAEAHASWSSTDWGESSSRATYLREDEVAAALDELARRIRSGELSLHQFRGSPPEAAIAAAFASLLRNRG
jgi:hypothetical protein